MPGIGLAPITGTDMLPEASAAAAINDNARAVTQPPRGIGLAQPMNVNLSPDIQLPTDAPMPEMPDMAPEQAPQAPAPKEKFYDFQDHPVATIGRMLGQFAAGYRGTPGPLDDFQKQQIEEQAMQYKTAALALDAVDKIVPLVLRAPAKQRGDIIKDLDQRFSGALGGHSLAPFLTALTAGSEEQAQSVLAAIKELNPSPSMLSYFSSNPTAAVKFLDDYNAHKASQDSPDRIKEVAKATAQGTDEGTPDKPRETEVVDLGDHKELVYKDDGKTIRKFPVGMSDADISAQSAQYNSEANNLRSEFTTNSKPFVQVRDAYATMKSAAKKPSPASDLAIIFGYMKMLDPGSVVRETEQATAANAPGVPAQVRQWWNQALGGNPLLDSRRQDIMNRAKDFYDVKARLQEAHEEEYRRLATSRKINPDDAVVNYRTESDGSGTGAAPPGIDPEDWAHATPEERALWQK